MPISGMPVSGMRVSRRVRIRRRSREPFVCLLSRFEFCKHRELGIYRHVFLQSIAFHSREVMSNVLPPQDSSLSGTRHQMFCRAAFGTGAHAVMIKKLTDEEQQWIAEFCLSETLGKVLQLRSGETLFEKGSSVTKLFFVIDGQIELLSTFKDGRVGIHEIIHRHGWVDAEALNDLIAHEHSAVATTQTKLVAFELVAFHQLLD